MPLPTVITDLSTTAASNYPAGSDSPTVLDDVQRAHASFIASLRDNPTANASTLTPIAKGGTGASTAPTALTALGAAALGANADITSLTALTYIFGVPTRQTVLSGPNTTGIPTFLPATSVNLNLTSQNISTGVNALVATAAGGSNAQGAVNAVGQATANLTWTGCTASNTNYLPVSIASGALTALTPVILAPVYQFGGTPSTTNGQYTYNIQEGVMYLGNGATAPAVNHVIVGEAVAGASTITSTVAYAYQGKYVSGYTSTLPPASTTVSKSHNIGTVYGVKTGFRIKCLTTDSNYAVGDIVNDPWRQGGVSNSSVITPAIDSRNSMRVITGSSLSVGVFDRNTGAGAIATTGNWAYELTAERGW